MDTGIFDVIRKAGYDVKMTPVVIDVLSEYHFAIKSYKLLSQFCAHSQKHHKNLIYTEFFIKNLNQNFRNKDRKMQADEISRYLSILLEKDRSSEVEIYYNLMFNRVNIKTAKLYMALFSDVRAITPDLYETPHKLFKGVRIDIQKALDIAYGQLKGELTLESFTSSLTKYIENNGTNKSYIPGSVVVNYVLLAYLMSHNYMSNMDYNSTPLSLDWSSNNALIFTVKANRGLKSSKDINNGGLDGKGDHDKMRKRENSYGELPEHLLVNGDGNSNLVKICHPCVFGNNESDESDDKKDDDIRREILVLKNKLEKQKLEHSLQQNIWKIILFHLKNSFQSYGIAEDEFESLERILETMSGVLNRNTEEWRSVFHEKKEYRARNYKYLFLISTLLEGMNQNIHHDLNALDLPDDHDGPMVSLFEKLSHIDLSPYFSMTETEEVSDENHKEEEVEPVVEMHTNNRSIAQSNLSEIKASRNSKQEPTRRSIEPNGKKSSIRTTNQRTMDVVYEVKDRSKTFTGKLNNAEAKDPQLTQINYSMPASPFLDNREQEKLSQLKENLGKVKQQFNDKAFKK